MGFLIGCWAGNGTKQDTKLKQCEINLNFSSKLCSHGVKILTKGLYAQNFKYKLQAKYNKIINLGLI